MATNSNGAIAVECFRLVDVQRSLTLALAHEGQSREWFHTSDTISDKYISWRIAWYWRVTPGWQSVAAWWASYNARWWSALGINTCFALTVVNRLTDEFAFLVIELRLSNLFLVQPRHFLSTVRLSNSFSRLQSRKSANLAKCKSLSSRPGYQSEQFRDSKSKL